MQTVWMRTQSSLGKASTLLWAFVNRSSKKGAWRQRWWWNVNIWCSTRDGIPCVHGISRVTWIGPVLVATVCRLIRRTRTVPCWEGHTSAPHRLAVPREDDSAGLRKVVLDTCRPNRWGGFPPDLVVEPIDFACGSVNKPIDTSTPVLVHLHGMKRVDAPSFLNPLHIHHVHRLLKLVPVPSNSCRVGPRETSRHVTLVDLHGPDGDTKTSGASRGVR